MARGALARPVRTADIIIRVPAATTQPILLSACVPPQQPPGVYAGDFRLKALDNTTLLTVEIPVRLEVWPLPPLLETDHPDAFSTLFRFDERDMVSFYPSYDVTGAANGSTGARTAWLKFLSRYRLPIDLQRNAW